MKLHVILPFSICTLIILCFFTLISVNAVNIPVGDDLYCLLLFAQEFQDASSIAEKLRLLTEQWVEHRIVFSKSTAIISKWLHGEVNFHTIILIGNLSLVGFTVLFWKLIKRTGVSMYYLIPVVLTLFSPVMYEANLWAGACTVYMPVCFMGLLAMYLIASKSRTSFVAASLISILATFSFGNGMFSFLAGFMMLIYLKRYKKAAIWAVLSAASITLYFTDFEAYSSTKAFDFLIHFRHPEYLFYNLFGFLGGIVDYLENDNMSVQIQNLPTLVLGAILSVAAIWGLFVSVRSRAFRFARSDDKTKVIWMGMALFMAITAVAMAYSRTSGQTMNTLASRYKIYSMIAFILVYCWCLIYFQKKKLIGFIFGTASLMLLIFNFYVHYEKINGYKSSLLSGLFNYTNNKQWVIYNHTAYYEGASILISDSISRNSDPVFSFKNPFPELNNSTLKNAGTLTDVNITESQNCDGRTGTCLTVQSQNYPAVRNSNQGVYLVVYNENNIFLYPASLLKNGRFNMLFQGHYFKPGLMMDKNLGNSLVKGNVYSLAVFCPTEKEQIKLLNYTLKI